MDSIQKPRLLLVGNFLSAQKGGTRAVCEELAELFASDGYAVHTTSTKQNRLLRLVDFIHTCWSKQEQYDLAQVDVYSGPAFYWAEAACWTLRNLDKPYLLTLHGGNLPAFAQRYPRRVRNLLKSAAAVTTPSPYLKEKLDHFRPDMQIIRNPIDLQNYSFSFRTKIKTLVWLRAFHEIYNPQMAVRVLAHLHKEFPNLRLCMIGPEKDKYSRNQTILEARRLQISDHVAFTGPVAKSAVPAWLSKGDAFINTTNIDNSPVSVVEAMACGLPVVSTDVGGIPYLLDHEKNALLVPPDDHIAMAESLKGLIKNQEKRHEISSNAKQLVSQFDKFTVLQQWEKQFARVFRAN